MPKSFSIKTDDLGTIWVPGMVTKDGIFGMHFAHSRAIHVTHIATGLRIHPEPGFADLLSAAEFAERVQHLDWDDAKKLDEASRQFLQNIYRDYLLSR